MDNFQAIGQLVIKAQDLLDSIKGGAIRMMQTQFDALKVQFSDKLVSVNSELASFITQQKAQVNSIFSEPDTRYQKIEPVAFTIEGDEDKFYPVIFGSADVNRLVDIHIGRFVHANGSGKGAMYAKFRVSSFAWGGRPGTMLLEVLKTLCYENGPAENVREDGFVADYKDAGYHPLGVVVWLRGGYSYEAWCDGSNLATVSATMNKQRMVGSDEAIIYLDGYESTINGNHAVIDILTTRNTTTVPSFTNYERA